MRIRLIILFFSLLGTIKVSAQNEADTLEIDDEPSNWTKPSDDEKSRLGIIMGIQVSTIFGNAIPDNRPMFGVLGGGYGRVNFKYGWSLQQELQVSFRGSSFSAEPGEISSFRLLYMDAPFLIMKKLKVKSKHSIGLGIQYSYLLSGNMYLSNNPYPTGQSPKLDKNDWLPMAAYQYQFEYFALQLNGKYGLRNLNLGEPWPESAKPLNNGGELHNFVVELNVIF